MQNQKTDSLKKLQTQRGKIRKLYANHYWEISDEEAEIVLEIIEEFSQQ